MLLAVSALFVYSGGAQADSVASLLGNYSISQFVRMDVHAGELRIHYVVDMAALPALRALHKADANNDGSTSTAERNAYLQTLVPDFISQLKLNVDGKPVSLQADGLTSDLPPEQSGFSLRIDSDYFAVLPGGANAKPRRVTLQNNNYAGHFGWHEMVVVAAPGIAVYDTNAVSTSATGELHQNPETLPPSGPLDERKVHLEFKPGPAPVGAALLQPRPGHPTGSAMASAAPDKTTPAIKAPAMLGGAWLVDAMNRLARMISTPNITPSVFALALLVATFLGALHALSPGHGKTLVGAYLVGSRGTTQHAIFLGITVTITHTLGVFLLGFATLFASRYFVPEKVFPVISFVSGLMVVGIGAALFWQRWRSTRAPAHSHHTHDHDHSHGHDHPHHEHDHAHNHAHHDHQHNDADALVHSHGGVTHSHLPPATDDGKISWRALLVLGISGGLVPCPSALVLLLAAVAVQRIAAGLVLVVAFSVGLAVTLTVVGLLFLYARDFLKGSAQSNRLFKILPVVSAAFITLVGVVICYGAVVAAV